MTNTIKKKLNLQRVIAAILSIQFIVSCASLFNESTTSIKVNVTKPSYITLYDSTIFVEEEAEILLLRSKKPTTLLVTQDTLAEEFLLEPRNSENFYANALFNYGIGFLWDWNKAKRYTYPDHLYLDLENWETSSKRFAPAKPGRLSLTLSSPRLNNFHFKPKNHNSVSNTGFLGYSAGVEYSYKKFKYIEATVSLALDFPLPVAAPYDPGYGEWEKMNTLYACLTDNMIWRDNTTGFGIVYAQNIWSYTDYRGPATDISIYDSMSSSTESIGVVGNMYHRFGKRFYLGIIYRPTLFRLKPSAGIEYEHLLSLDLKWKFRLYG